MRGRRAAAPSPLGEGGPKGRVRGAFAALLRTPLIRRFAAPSPEGEGWRVLAFLLLLLLSGLASGETRRRAVTPPSDQTPASWLASHAYPLATTEAVGDLNDLSPLRAIVGNASVVGLADGTHGTHEYFTTKLRIIEFLVTQMGFGHARPRRNFPADRARQRVRAGPVDRPPRGD